MEKVIEAIASIVIGKHSDPVICIDQSVIGNAAKRIFDVLCSIIGMIVFSPLYLCIYIAIKREDHGCAIFKQERIGYRGEPFTLYKFRSMTLSAEADGKPALCMKEDDRLTAVGHFLRSHHLDELPQLWNVFKGEMSFVGYRPERRYFIEKIMQRNSDYIRLYDMRPGLFSMATLYNGYTDTMEKMLTRLDMDLDYLDNHSLWIDIKVIWLTAYSILSGKKF